ncbi:MAG: lytic transglycosylase domain-containing protein, partial [Gammaproteobacteria bacterium]
VPIECINQAAVAHHVPAALLVSVLKVEGGRAGMAKKNTNGSYDYGPMQINSIWLEKLGTYGYAREHIQYDPCVNMWVGAWILSQRIAASDNLWRGVASYHSYTDDKNLIYQKKVIKAYDTLSRQINGLPT